MREERVIALAGLLQAIGLVRAIATRGGADASAMQPSLASIFRIDAPSTADVFGGLANLHSGLQTLISQLNDAGRDLSLTRIASTALRVQRRLLANRPMQDKLRTGIQTIARQTQGQEVTSHVVVARLAGLYTDTLSTLKPRILVEGDPQYLRQETQVAQIRALLLAAVRAAVLWRQLGGSQWSLIFRYRQYSMMARGLLARSTLNG